MADTIGMKNIRGEAINSAVTAFALREYRFKQLCMETTSAQWKQTYYKESSTDLTGGTGASIKGVPRGAGFPHVETNWTEATGNMAKYGAETIVYWEDIVGDNIDVLARASLRNARAVAKAVDAEIWDVISESQSAVNITSVSIATGHEWDSADTSNQDPIKDILNAKSQIEAYDYDADTNGYLLLSPTDYKNILANASVRNAGQFYDDGATRNGRVGRICGLTIIKSNNVTADYALVIIGKEACTWIQGAPLTTITKVEEGISKTIRSYEFGMAQLKNPKAVCLIDNTQA